MLLLSRAAAVLFVVAVPILLVTTNVRVLASEVRYYRHGFREYDAEARTGIPLRELDRAGTEIVDYFHNDADTLRIVVNANGEEESLFNARETAHMRDVKALMRTLFRVQEGTLAFVLSYVTCVFLWSSERSLRRLATLSLLGIGAGLVFVAAVGFFVVSGFDSAWTALHEVIFRNDFWQLDPDTDHLIQMFPEPFWEEASYIVGLASAAEAIVIAVIATLYLAVAREPRPEAGAPLVAPGEGRTPGHEPGF
jgi:integral membrane protein (TIGR01906 family)